jgi:hypothetical protein
VERAIGAVLSRIKEVKERLRAHKRWTDVEFLWPEVLANSSTRTGAYDEFYRRVRGKWAWRGWSRDKVVKRLTAIHMGPE